MTKKTLAGSEQDSDPLSGKQIAMISTHGYVAAEPPLGAPDTGGQVVYVLELSRVLARLGYHVDIYTRRFEQQSQFEKVEDDVDIIRIPCGGEDFIDKEYMVDHISEWSENALDFIKSSGKEYLFINSHYWDAGLAGDELSGKLGIPHLHTPHSVGSWKKKKMETDFPDSAEDFEKQYNFSQRIEKEKMIYNRADSLIATTPIQKRLINNDYSINDDKIKMIPPGYDDNRFYPMGDASKAMLKEKFNFRENCIFALSRLAHNKGLDLLVEAFSRVRDAGMDAQLVLAVGHDERNETEKSIYDELIEIADKRGIGDSVHFIGFIPDEDLADIYRAADIFVLSSRYEPFGMTAVEAMASGTPTIVTKHGGLCEVVEDGTNALISDPFKPEELAADIISIIKHEGISKHLAAEGSIFARENYSWTEIAMNLLRTTVRDAV